MFFLPFAFLIFILFIIFLPVLFFLGYFHIIAVGFESLGISPQATLVILYSILVGSLINIPLTKKKLVLVREPGIFGLFRRPRMQEQYLAVNLGGAVIPFVLSLYFLFQIRSLGYELQPVLVAVLLMSIVSKMLSKVVPGKGIAVPAFIPPVFSALFSLALAPQYAAACAFVSGVLGTLIGADLFNLFKIKSYRGYISIGGAGVFDGILLVGIVSALLSGL